LNQIECLTQTTKRKKTEIDKKEKKWGEPTQPGPSRQPNRASPNRLLRLPPGARTDSRLNTSIAVYSSPPSHHSPFLVEFNTKVIAHLIKFPFREFISKSEVSMTQTGAVNRMPFVGIHRPISLPSAY
jgi:hypothetical protein